MQRTNFQQRTFKLKVAEDTFNDETRVKVSIVRTDVVNYENECKVRVPLLPRPVLRCNGPRGTIGFSPSVEERS